jgi:hypothetical protein
MMSGAMADTRSQPTEEGSVLRWPKEKEKDPEPGELDPQEYHAALGTHRVFVKMAERKFEQVPHPSKRPELDHFLPALDAHRSNHTVLIDGPRGSGKTAVMLRLIHDWSELLRGNEIPNAPAEVAGQKEKKFEIVPVGLLDLEAVPQTANLATRVAGQFERVVAAMERRGVNDEPPRAAWATLESDALKSRQKWQRFVNAAALEWDRSLERRRATIDPEAYAVEVEQAESRGMHARESFREFVDALVKDWESWSPRRTAVPFFVVPIDDADLNPGRVVELFGLLRTLWHPRVGYLLTGDSGLFVHVLTSQFHSQINAPLLGEQRADGLFRALTLRAPNDAAERLARDYYQKAVSLENCLRLQALPGSIRLNFVRKSLRSSEALSILAKYIEADNVSSLALPGRWRKLKDLRDLIDSRKNIVPGELALRFWQDALDDSVLAGNELDEMRKLVELTDQLNFVGTTWPALSFYPTPPPFLPATVPALAAGVRTKDARAIPQFGRKLRASFRYNDKQEDERRYVGTVQSPQNVRWLDSSAVGALALMSSLAGFTVSAPILVVSACSLGDSARSRVRRFVPHSFTLVWQVPGSQRLYEQQVAVRLWNLQAVKFRNDSAELGKVFLSVVTKAWGLRDDDVDVLDWDKLAGIVVDRIGVDNDVVSRWCVRATLLAAPEWGLPPKSANAWLGQIRERAISAGKWEKLRNQMRAFRWDAIRDALYVQFVIRGDTQSLEAMALSQLDELSRLDGVERVVGYLDGFRRSFKPRSKLVTDSEAKTEAKHAILTTMQEFDSASYDWKKLTEPLPPVSPSRAAPKKRVRS